jgi:hypothetical protein
MSDLTAVFGALRSIMAPYAEPLDVKKDEASELYVDTPPITSRQLSCAG